VWEKLHDKIQLGEFVEDWKFPGKKKYQYQRFLATPKARIVIGVKMRYC